MASFHCSVKVGKSGSGAAHADYIEREGKYASKSKDDLEHKESGNMPEFAETSGEFWSAADQHERANGSVYREFEIALPRELTQVQRLELVREFIEHEIGDRHAYTFAIHNPKAAIDGGEQPHAHIMFSERKRDGIERPAEQYFKRWNAKQPERGGCQKAGTAKTPTERKAELVQLRQRFAELQNKHLAKSGHSVQVTHLSLAAQGIDREVEPHFGPKLAKELAEAVKVDRAASKTPELPNDLNAAVELYRHVRAALERGDSERKREESQEREALHKAKEALNDSEGMAKVVVHQVQQLGKRPLLGGSTWNAKNEALRAQFAEAKATHVKAQESIKAIEKRIAAVQHGTPSLDERIRTAILSLKLPYTQQTLDQLQLGAKTLKERQETERQAKVQERAAQQPKGQSR